MVLEVLHRCQPTFLFLMLSPNDAGRHFRRVQHLFGSRQHVYFSIPVRVMSFGQPHSRASWSHGVSQADFTTLEPAGSDRVLVLKWQFEKEWSAVVSRTASCQFLWSSACAVPWDGRTWICHMEDFFVFCQSHVESFRR